MTKPSTFLDVKVSIAAYQKYKTPKLGLKSKNITSFTN